MKEIFKNIEDYEGYQISNLGSVKSFRRKTPKILKPIKNRGGYLVVDLQSEGKTKTRAIHQLVAITFLNHVPNGRKIIVDHIDNDQSNNKLENLQLITFRENCSKDKKGSSSYTGVSWDKNRNLWRSSITLNSKHVHLGRFKTEEEAHNEYQKALNNFLKTNK